MQRLFALSVLVMLSGCFSAYTHPITKISNNESEMSVGVSVVSLRDKKVLYSRDAQKLFTPASTAKLFTIAAALHYLGPQYRYSTELLSAERGAQISHLYLKASGDPSLSSSDLANLIAELHQLGVRSVTGNIVIDTSIFDDVAYGSGWMLEDMNEGYSAPISGISVDHNRIAFGFFAGSAANAPLGITNFPSTNYFSIVNKALTGPAASKARVTLAHANAQGITKGEKISIGGQMPLGAATKYESLSVNDPVDFAGFLIAEEFKKNHIAFKGKVLRGKVPPKAMRLTHHVSSPLSEMAIDFVKMSNNHAMEMLVKTIAVSQSGAPGSFDNGLSAMRRFLETKVGVKMGGAVTADGSGLSRYNQVSAKHFTDLLAYMWSDFRAGPEFVASLALFGEDGTLKDGKGDTLVGNVRAKTGSMTNLRSLAGYMRLDDGDVLAFAVMTNGTNQGKQKQVIEDILTSMKKR